MLKSHTELMPDPGFESNSIQSKVNRWEKSGYEEQFIRGNEAGRAV